MRKDLPGAMLLAALAAGSACNTAYAADDCDTRNFDEINLKPGCAGLCTQQPCAVSFTLPAGSGTYRVSDGAFVLGSGTGGETVELGFFWQGSHRLRALDAAGQSVGEAYLTVSGDPD